MSTVYSFNMTRNFYYLAHNATVTIIIYYEYTFTVHLVML